MTDKQSTGALQTELDGVMRELESDELDIDQAAELYERGLKLLAELKARLEKTENKITKLNETFDA